MLLAIDLGNRGVFMELRKSETDWGSSRDLRCTKRSEFKEKRGRKENTKSVGEEKERKKNKRGERKKRKERFTRSGWAWSLSF